MLDTFILILAFSILFFFTENQIPSEAKGYLFLFALLVNSIIIYVYIYIRPKAYTNINIDSQGIHYWNKYRQVFIKDILWKDFTKTPNPTSKSNIYNHHGNDLYSLNPGRYSMVRKSFFWIVKNEKAQLTSESFVSTHVFDIWFANRRELIRTFLLGLAHFCPNIKVNPNVFDSFFIAPETYKFQLAKRNKLLLTVIIFTIIILVVLYFVVQAI